jgi:hypothetical protein
MGRIVKGTIYHGTDQPWANTRITFELKKGSFTANRQYPKDRVVALTDALGYFEADLWVNAEGLQPSKWICRLPDGENFDFVLPTGAIPIDLSELRVSQSWTTPSSLSDILDPYFLSPDEADARYRISGESIPASEVVGTFADSQIPASIARDSEVAAAIAQHNADLSAHPGLGGGGPGGSSLIATFAYDFGNTYTLPIAPIDPASTLIFINGAKQRYGADYNFNGTVLNWVSADLTLSTGDTIEVYQ